MKNTFLINSFSNRILSILMLVTILNLTVSFTSFAASGDSDHKTQGAKKQPKGLGEQISQFIHLEDTDLANGIVVISFTIDENSQLSDVVSYSQIPAIDRYLTGHLEGKEVELPAGHTGNHGKQFIKLRFALER